MKVQVNVYSYRGDDGKIAVTSEVLRFGSANNGRPETAVLWESFTVEIDDDKLTLLHTSVRKCARGIVDWGHGNDTL